jgi:histidine phosphotransferase ChpT
MTDVDHLGTLIAQRLCHDLVNPLGAIGNGLELLAMSQARTPEMDLMKDSLEQALRRIKLYRLAFGPAPAGARLPGMDLAAALDGLGGSRPIVLALDLPADLPRTDARLAVLLALCAETALAWGGHVSLRIGAGTDTPIELIASAPRLRHDPDLWAALAAGQPPEDVPPPMVQFVLATGAARAAGRKLGVETLSDRVLITA